MEIIGKTNFDFIGKRMIAFAISSVIAITGILGIIQIARGAANMGIDFSGGTAVQLKFEEPIPMDQVRTALAKHNMKEANLQEIKDGNKLLIKMGHTSIAQGKVSDAIQEVFKKEFPSNSFVVESSTEIGPSIGDKLRIDTLKAVTISLIGIILYIAWRFDFKFGIGATLATTHDVLAMFAVFFIMGKEINLLFITAVLTIAGYSLTDTVVVFDRIRENMHKNTKESMPTIFNRSINEVLSRTIVTSLTVFMAAMSLVWVGGEVIHDFAFALVIGVIVGTYSSVFVASPIVAVWEERAAQKVTQKA